MSDVAKCCHCGKDIFLTAHVPESQTLTVKITSKSKCVVAEVLGGMLTSTAACLKEVARSIGTPVEVFAHKIHIKGGVAEAHLSILATTTEKPEVTHD